MISPPTFIKGVTSHIAFKDTKYSGFSGKSSKKDDNQIAGENSIIYELQEVKEQTIYEEEMVDDLNMSGKVKIKNLRDRSHDNELVDRKDMRNLTKKQ